MTAEELFDACVEAFNRDGIGASLTLINPNGGRRLDGCVKLFTSEPGPSGFVIGESDGALVARFDAGQVIAALKPRDDRLAPGWRLYQA
jgi:hypothetical protein